MNIKFVSVLLGTVLAAGAQVVNFTGIYSENFDSMGTADPATVPNGWYVGAATGGNGILTTVGANQVSTTQVRTRDGTSGTIRNMNVGTAGSSERALGSIAGGAAGGDLNLEVQLRNNTGAAITSLEIRYDGEQWRANGVTEAPQYLTLTICDRPNERRQLGDVSAGHRHDQCQPPPRQRHHYRPGEQLELGGGGAGDGHGHRP